MAFAWVKRMFGFGVDHDVVSSKNAAVSAKASPTKSQMDLSEAEDLRHETQPSASKTKRYREYLLELDHAFCLLIYGSERIYLTPTEDQRAKAKRYAKKIASEELHSECIPRKPSSLPLLMRLLRLDDVNNDDVATLLIKDPALTSQVLKTANSPFFRLNDQSVDSLDEAIRRLGLGGIKRVASAATLQPVFQAQGVSKGLSEAVWNWALNSGASLEALSHAQGEDAQSNYLLGLIPELAMLLVNQELDRLEQNIAPEERILPMQRLSVFKRVAWKLCIQIREEWGMPEAFDKALYAMGDAMRLRGDALVYDAILLAQYAAVEASGKPPISIQKLSLLTESDEHLNTTVLAALKAKQNT